MNIRTYLPGDEVKQVEIYNLAAAALPGFKPVKVEDQIKRIRFKDFDPQTRLYAVEKQEIIGYIQFQKNGRLGYPWTLPKYESAHGFLLSAALKAMSQMRIPKALVAYRCDWKVVLDYWEKNEWSTTYEVVNFFQSISDLPTLSNRHSHTIEKLLPSDLERLAKLVPGMINLPVHALEDYFFQNRFFTPYSLLAVRNPDGLIQAAGFFLQDMAFANVTQVDSQAPCFRLGAFGTEGMNVKRINGMFSILAPVNRDLTSIGLDLVKHALEMYDDLAIDYLAAQITTQQTHLLDFYRRYFRRQGSFKVYEKKLLESV